MANGESVVSVAYIEGWTERPPGCAGMPTRKAASTAPSSNTSGSIDSKNGWSVTDGPE